MSNAGLFPWLLLAYLFTKKEKPKPLWPAPIMPVAPPLPILTPSPPPLVVHPAAVPVHIPVAPPAWPAVLPPGLPPFPGPGWVPDSPPGPGVVARAFALLPQLWARGQGATATEQTAGRWITYVARMVGTKKSVIAYRLSNAVYADPEQGGLVVAPAPPPPAGVPPGAPVVPAVYHPAAAPPAAVPAAAPPQGAPAGPKLPTLRLTHPNTKGPSVIYLQQKLGIPADGIFGSGTDRAVRSFQTTHGLAADGIVGPNTWAAFG